MAFFTSTTSSGYSDPLKALNIKALEARQKQQASMPTDAITPENTQTPMQGMAHVFSQLGDSMAQQRTIQALADRQAGFKSGLAHMDWEHPTSAMLAELDANPEFLQSVIQSEYEKRKNAATIAGENARNAATNQTNITTTGMQQEGATARTSMEVTGRSRDTDATITGHHQDVDKQQGSETERANLNNANNILLHQMDNDVKQAEGEASRAAATGDLKLRTAADLNLEKVKAGYNLRLAEVNNQSAEKIAAARAEVDRLNNITTNATSEANTAANNATSERNTAANNAATLGVMKLRIAGDAEAAALDRTLKIEQGALNRATESGIAADKIAAQERVAKAENELKERLAILQGKAPQTAVGKINLDAANKNISETDANVLRDAATRTSADVVEKLETSKEQYRQTGTLEGQVKTALDYVKGGVNEGLSGAAKSGIEMITGNKLVDEAQVKRTREFNNIVDSLAVMDMSKVLKGSSTDREMAEFKKVKNDPYSTLPAREQALKNLLIAIETDKGIYASSIKQLGGDTEDIDKSMGRMTTGDPNKAVPRPEGKDDAALLSEAQAEMAKSSPKRKAAIQQQLKEWNVKGAP